MIRANAWKIAPVLLLIVVWLVSNASHDGTAQASGVAGDKAALMAFYKATNGDGWKTNTNWNSNKPLGQWHGVTTNTDGRVTELDLRSNNLKGIIPPEIGKLTELTNLDLYAGGTTTNSITGPVPPEIGKLTKLTTLDIGYNRVTGSLPPEFGNLTALDTFYGDSTYLSGALPVEVVNIKPWLYDGNGDGTPDDTTKTLQFAMSIWSAPSFGNTRGLCLGLQPEINEWLKGEGYTGTESDPFINATMEDSRCLILMETSPSYIEEPTTGSKDVEVTVTAKVNHIIGAEVNLPLNALGGNATRGAGADYEIVGTAPTSITIPADAMEGSATYTIRVHSDTNHAEREHIRFSGSNAKYPNILDSNDNPTAVPKNTFYNYGRTNASLRIIDPYTITLTASPDTIEEGSSDKDVSVTVKATIDPAPSAAVAVTTSFAGDATSADYSATAPTIAIPANATSGSATFTLTVKNNDDTGETDEDMDRLTINGSASAGGSSVAVNGDTVVLREPPTDLGEALFGATSTGMAHWDYVIPGGKAQDYDHTPVKADGMEFDYYEVRWMETSKKAVGAGWVGKSSKVFYNSDAASFQIPNLKPDTEYKAKLFVGLFVGDKRYYATSDTTTFTTPSANSLQALGKPLFRASPTGSVDWRYDSPEWIDSHFDYYEVRWMKTSDKAVGAGWAGKSNRVFYMDRVSHFNIPNLEAGTEYKAMLFVGVSADRTQLYVKSDTVTFTTPSERADIAFSVSAGLAKWSDNRFGRSKYGIYEVQWKDASKSGWGERSSRIFFDDEGAFQIPHIHVGKRYTARLYAGQHPSEADAKNNHYSKEVTFTR